MSIRTGGSIVLEDMRFNFSERSDGQIVQAQDDEVNALIGRSMQEVLVCKRRKIAPVRFVEIWLMFMLMLICCERKILFLH